VRITDAAGPLASTAPFKLSRTARKKPIRGPEPHEATLGKPIIEESEYAVELGACTRTSGTKIAESEERFHAIAGELEPVLTVAVRRTGEYNVGLNVLVVKAEEGHD
jgi:hypothetical protein